MGFGCFSVGLLLFGGFFARFDLVKCLNQFVTVGGISIPPMDSSSEKYSILLSAHSKTQYESVFTMKIHLICSHCKLYPWKTQKDTYPW
jgi:hypothetical protein